jgi:hypothetical protein
MGEEIVIVDPEQSHVFEGKNYDTVEKIEKQQPSEKKCHSLQECEDE